MPLAVVHQEDVRCRVVADVEVGVCLLYTSDAADERSSVDLGGRRIIKKKNVAQMSAARSDRIQNYAVKRAQG